MIVAFTILYIPDQCSCLYILATFILIVLGKKLNFTISLNNYTWMISTSNGVKTVIPANKKYLSTSTISCYA